MRSLIVINFKTYPEAVGKKALPLAKELAKVKSRKYEIIVVPSLLTLKEVAKVANAYSQHADLTLGSHTGSIPVKELKELGVKGTLLNHSEKKIPLKQLKKTINLCKKQQLKTIVCTSTISETKKVAKLHPNFIAYEPKGLIGGNISVTEAKPKIIIKAVEVVKKISSKTKVLCGAGIHSREDLGHALLLGTHGVLIGHAVPKAKDPRKFLEESIT